MSAQRPRPSYARAVDWIARNDEDVLMDESDIEEMSGLISVVLVADLWGKDPGVVARDVIKMRRGLWS